MLIRVADGYTHMPSNVAPTEALSRWLVWLEGQSYVLGLLAWILSCQHVLSQATHTDSGTYTFLIYKR